MIRPEILESLADVCARKGIRHLKTRDIELCIDLNHLPERANLGRISGESRASSIEPAKVEPVQNQQSTEQINELINTLKLPDEELLNKIFPDGAGG
jgi:hypothetical protein